MNIEFIDKVKNKQVFTVDENLEVRIKETRETIIFKLRNNAYSTAGRKLLFENIESISEVIFDKNTYSNLHYNSHEVYIHNISQNSLDKNMVEDISITFEKREELL